MRIAKEQWIDKLRYKWVKLEECINERKKKENNIKFQCDQKSFLKTLGDQTWEGKNFAAFWSGIRKKNKRTLNMPWMKEVKRLLGAKVTAMNEFDIDTEKLKKQISKRKS